MSSSGSGSGESSLSSKTSQAFNSVKNAFTTSKAATISAASSVSSFTFDYKTGLIIALLLILVLSSLGINLFWFLGNVTENVNDVLGPLLRDFWYIFGYTSGSVINETSGVVATVSKTGIDLADGAIQDVGNLLKDSATGGSGASPLSNSPSMYTYNVPHPTSASNPIMTSASNSKGSWCLVGEHRGTRGCVEVGDSDKCMSNQLFPNKQMCLNPTMTAY